MLLFACSLTCTYFGCAPFVLQHSINIRDAQTCKRWYSYSCNAKYLWSFLNKTINVLHGCHTIRYLFACVNTLAPSPPPPSLDCSRCMSNICLFKCNTFYASCYLSFFSLRFRRSNSHFCCWINFLICWHLCRELHTSLPIIYTTLIEHFQTSICRYAFIIFDHHLRSSSHSLLFPFLSLLNFPYNMVDCEYFTSETAKSSKKTINSRKKNAGIKLHKKITYGWSVQNKIHENEWGKRKNNTTATTRDDEAENGEKKKLASRRETTCENGIFTF